MRAVGEGSLRHRHFSETVAASAEFLSNIVVGTRGLLPTPSRGVSPTIQAAKTARRLSANGAFAFGMALRSMAASAGSVRAGDFIG